MKARSSRRGFLKMALLSLGATFLAACERLVKPTPTALPTSTVASSETVMPQPTNTRTLEAIDIPVYKNSFEGTTDLAGNGITSTNNDLRINTENVDYQSGSQSLEAYGAIAGPAYSALTIDLSIKKLTGVDTVDLSNKTVGFSFYIPADSPIDTIILVARAGTKEVSLAANYGSKRGEWQYKQFDLKSVYENNAWVWTDLSNDEAKDVTRNCREITIAGMRPTDGATAPTSFLVDDFKWIGIEDINHIQLDDDVDSMRKYANSNHIKIGAWLIRTRWFDWFADPWYLRALAQEFNMTTVGGVGAPESKPADLAAVEFDYTLEDQKLAFAEGNGMFLRGGTGGWHSQIPQWLLDANYDELRTFLERGIEQDMTHFKGRVFCWGVFNEVVDDGGNGFRNRQNKYAGPTDAYAPYGYHYSPWVDGNDTSLIEAAFIKARAVDSQAKLHLNEYYAEEMGNRKAEFLYNFVIGMKNKGIPIDGVGFQLHLMYPNTPWMPDLENLDAYLDRVDHNIKRYAEAGLSVEFTEVEVLIRLDDIDLATQAGRDEHASRVQKQADIYAGLIRLAKDNPNVVAFTFWTVTDRTHSSAFDVNNDWYTISTIDASLFDKNYEPKPAYYAVMAILKP